MSHLPSIFYSKMSHSLSYVLFDILEQKAWKSYRAWMVDVHLTWGMGERGMGRWEGCNDKTGWVDGTQATPEEGKGIWRQWCAMSVMELWVWEGAKRWRSEEWVGSPISQSHHLQSEHQSDNNSPPSHLSVAFSKLNTAGSHIDLGKLNKTLSKDNSVGTKTSSLI